MRNNFEIGLPKTSRKTDFVDLGICASVYLLCNDRQFEYCPSPLEFARFLNIEPDCSPLRYKEREKQRVCHVIYTISETIQPMSVRARWLSEFVELCGVGMEYYKRHCKDIESIHIAEGVYTDMIPKAKLANYEFKKKLDEALGNWYNLANSLRSYPQAHT